MARVIAALAGLWAMCAPAVLGTTGAARINDVVVGPIAATIAIVALAEVCAGLRVLLVPLGAWMGVAALWLATGAGVASDLAVAGALLIGGAAPVRTKHAYGGGWRALV